MKGKMTRAVTYEAEDTKVGMTALELLTALSAVPPEFVPTVEIKLNGKIKKIKLEVEFRAE
jgi:hypothetical protein